MKKFFFDWGWPLIGALLLALAQPLVLSGHYLNPHPLWGLLSLCALAPFLRAAEERRRGFWFGFLWGITYFAATLFWIAYAITHFGNLTLAAGVGILLLVLVLQSIFTGLFSWLLPRLNERWPSLFWAPALFTALEYARNYSFTGFSWCNPAYGLARLPFFIQPLDLAGIYGLTFLVILVNQLLARLVPPAKTAAAAPRQRRTELAAALLLVALLWPAYCGWRWSQRSQGATGARPLPVGLAQGNIGEDQKRHGLYFSEILATYLQSTKRLRDWGAQLVLWPEASLPRFIPANAQQIPWLGPETGGVPVFFGAVTYERTGEKDGLETVHNSGILTAADGKVLGLFHKTHLVPMSEYVPSWFVLPVKRMVQAAGDFVPGREVQPLSLPAFKFGPLICYESIFPEIARQHARQGAQLLAVITNDAWFGHSSGPYQHFYMAVFRAVENRLPLVRAANTGISAFIDRFGRVGPKLDFGIRGELLEAVELAPPSPTLYLRLGDLFAQLCAALCLLALLLTLRTRLVGSEPRAAVKRLDNTNGREGEGLPRRGLEL